MRMKRRNPRCMIFGHRWSKERRPDRTLLMTCRRCGELDVVEHDMGMETGGMGSGAGGLS